MQLFEVVLTQIESIVMTRCIYRLLSFFFFFLTGLKISDENDFWTKSILKSRNIQKMTKVQKKVENSILSNAKNGVVDLSTSIYAEMAT